jgi:beta-galactosidase
MARSRWSRREFLCSTVVGGTAGLLASPVDSARGSLLLLAGAPRPASGRLVSAVEVRQGVPRMVVNGRVMPPFLFFHGSIGGVAPKIVDVGPQWHEHGFVFTAPATDDNAAVHIRNAGGAGSLQIDDVRLFELRGGAPVGPNLVGTAEAPGVVEPGNRWSVFVAPAARATAQVEPRDAASGRAPLKIAIDNPGSEPGHVHVYQSGLRIEQGRRYAFTVKLRSDPPRKVQLLAAHQGPPWTIYGGQSSPAVEQIELSRDAGFHLRTFDMTVPWPSPGSPPDYGPGDAEVRAHLALDRDALLVPRLHTDAPRWWKEQHPDELMLYEDGRHPMASVASTVWRRDAEEALRLFVRHLEQAFGDHVLGYHVCGQSAGEWVYDQTGTQPPFPNFEAPFRDGFRSWLRTRYGTREALRQAWRDADADFPSVPLPSATQRRGGREATIRDPRRQRAVIDLFEYSQVAIVEALERFARAVKDEVRRTKLVFAFYGYLFEVAGFENGPQVTGHLLVDRVSRCPDIDVLCAPIAYFDREAGGSAPFMGPVDSIQLRGKLWLNEDDTRTYLSAEAEGTGRVTTLQATQWVHGRNFAQVLAHNTGLWWMDLNGQGWLAARPIWENLSALRGLWETVAPQPLRPDIAVVVDERSLLYLAADNAVTAPLLARLRYNVNRVGASVGYYLLSDLQAGAVPEARLYLLLNAFVVSAAEREALHRVLRNKGKWTVWFYAPGYLEPDGTAGDMPALTGLPVRRLLRAQALAVTMRPGSFAARGVPADQLSFGEPTPRAPAFTVGEDAAGITVLADYMGTQTPAVASVQRPEWSSVFVGSTSISTGVLRALARAAGARVWLETDDVLIVGNDFVALHASTAGAKELRVPAGTAITDTAPRGAAPRSGRVTVTMQRGETKLFRLGRA